MIASLILARFPVSASSCEDSPVPELELASLERGFFPAAALSELDVPHRSWLDHHSRAPTLETERHSHITLLSASIQFWDNPILGSACEVDDELATWVNEIRP